MKADCAKGLHYIVWTSLDSHGGISPGVYICTICSCPVEIGPDSGEVFEPEKITIPNDCPRCKKHVEDCRCPSRKWPA